MKSPPTPGEPSARSLTDTELFTDFVHAHSTRLHRTAFLLVGNRGLAQDLLQESLAKTWATWSLIREPEKAEAYCRRVMTRTAISWYRRRAWSSERAAETLPEVSVSSHEAGVDESQRIGAALLKLPPRQRAAVVLRYYDDLSEAETARLMGCAVGTIKSLTHSGLGKLRLLLPDVSTTQVASDLPHTLATARPAAQHLVAAHTALESR